MKRIVGFTATVLAIGIWSLPAISLAHHMGQGYGSAPEVVDDYAHGANAQSDNQSGYNVGMVDGPDGNGVANAMQGTDNNATGSPGGSDAAGSGDSGDGSGSDSGAGSGGSGGSDGGSGAGSSRN